MLQKLKTTANNVIAFVLGATSVPVVIGSVIIGFIVYTLFKSVLLLAAVGGLTFLFYKAKNKRK